ncbi:MAG: hypothetical protein ACTSYJ_04425 [Candidatus Thorarchaeota archaeon]
MSIRKLPGTPIPHITKARNTRGSTGTKGAICLIVLGIFLYVALDYIINFMDDFVLPDIGIPYPLLFIIIIGCVILVIFVFTLKGGIVRGRGIAHGSNIVSRVRDPSVCKRVIKDGFGGVEYIVSGDGEDTFGQACKNHWQFVSVKRDSGWFIKDDRGNDVTEMSLISYDGICILIPEFGSVKPKDKRDEASKYSSIQDSVEYYD